MTRPAPDAPIETPWQGRYLAVNTKGNWEYVSRPGGMRAAVILAVDHAADGPHVILVEQYRVPLGKSCIEMPAGLVGDVDAGEAAHVAAMRELEEETGYQAATWREAGEFYSSPGMVSESFTLFLASDLTKTGQGGGVNDEDILVHPVPLAHIHSFIDEKRAAGCAIDVRLLLLLGGGLIQLAAEKSAQ